jgi:uncharacterized protein (DUF983 family)
MRKDECKKTKGALGFMGAEDGMGTVEIVIIVAVLVGIALIFRDQIIGFATSVMEAIFNNGEITEAVDPLEIRGAG